MTRIGLIDIGTNTIRLLIGESSRQDKPRFIDQQIISTRLGEGLWQTGQLSASAMDRTVDGLRKFQERAAGQKVEILETYGTAWAREASNTDAMLSRLAELNLPFWILTTREEASMAFESVKLMPEFQEWKTKYEKTPRGNNPLWVIDVGGGSTEIVEASGGKCSRIESIPLGAVTITEKFLHSDPPGKEIFQVVTEVKKRFAAFTAQDMGKPGIVAALGGTAAALSGLKIGIKPEEPEFFKNAQATFLSASWIEKMMEQISSLPVEERKKIRGMEPERADILPGGSALLLAFLSAARASGLTVCLYSFLHGLLVKRLAALCSGSRA